MVAKTEDAVRQYLLYLEDPNQLRDDKEIQRKTQAVLDASDPIDKLKALADLERVAHVEEGPLRKGFVENAKSWAEGVGVPVSAFRELKVPDDVLREAGFAVPQARGNGRGGGERQRAKAVSIDAVKTWILSHKGTFLLTDVISGAGGSHATARKAVDELIDAGSVQKLGPMPNYNGRGRPPTQYRTK